MQVWYNHLACVESVSVANFDVLAAQKLGREQKQKKEGGESREVPFSLSPSPLFIFCSRPNFRAAKTSKFATETLATQANNHHSISGVHRRGPTPQNLKMDRVLYLVFHNTKTLTLPWPSPVFTMHSVKRNTPTFLSVWSENVVQKELAHWCERKTVNVLGTGKCIWVFFRSLPESHSRTANSFSTCLSLALSS